MLAEFTGRAAPLVRVETFVAKTFNGGLYYNFLGVQGKSLDQVFANVGVVFTEIERFGSENWSALFASRVTGNRRAIAIVPALAPRATAGTHIVALTFESGDYRHGNDFILRSRRRHDLSR